MDHISGNASFARVRIVAGAQSCRVPRLRNEMKRQHSKAQYKWICHHLIDVCRCRKHRVCQIVKKDFFCASSLRIRCDGIAGRPTLFSFFYFLLLMSSNSTIFFCASFSSPFSSDVVNRACPSLDRSITALYHLPVASRRDRDETNIPRRVLGTGCAVSLPSSSSSPRRRYGSSRMQKKPSIMPTNDDLRYTLRLGSLSLCSWGDEV